MIGGYKFRNPEGIYFVSFSVVDWLDVFVKDQYINVLLDCLRFCQKEKGMEIYAWCIMPNHMHLVFKSLGKQDAGYLLGDFKRYTSNALVKAIQENPEEERKEFFLTRFKSAAKKTSRVKHHQFWQRSNMPKEGWSNWFLLQKINYTHNNPVKAGFVSKPEEYKYSSAVDYCGGKGLLEGIVISKPL